MNYCILGAARSGIAAARLASTLNKDTPNATTCVRELGDASDFADVIHELESLGIKCIFGKESQIAEIANSALKNIDCLILSPGIPNDAPFILEAKTLGIEVISELEFGFRHIKNPLIAITGTNGKTTTTTLATYMFNNAGIPSVSAGNIGLPLSDIANDILTGKKQIEASIPIIVEVSSYQLEFIDKFKPKIAVILNVTPDHLKYHKTFENYLTAKFKIAANQTSDDYLILNADDEALNNPLANKLKQNIKATILYISQHPIERGYYLSDDALINNLHQSKEEVMQLKDIRIPGLHNRYNSMAAAAAASIWQISNEDIRDSLKQFQGVEHRLEYVRTIGNVDYINDSKATNVNATWYALNSYDKPIVWIAGGRGDHNDYAMLDSSVAKNVVKIIAIGEEQEIIYNRYCDIIDSYKADDLWQAVTLASNIASPNQIVLFTPACKSFDQFSNFEQRGEAFKQAVMQLGILLN
jgi:UDP-N-acetylmuramoylalanine--D-glutamate ligase